MTNNFFETYRNLRDLIKEHERREDEKKMMDDLVEDWKEVVAIIEKAHPKAKVWYEGSENG